MAKKIFSAVNPFTLRSSLIGKAIERRQIAVESANERELAGEECPCF
jgi:hypothetical protein